MIKLTLMGVNLEEDQKTQGGINNLKVTQGTLRADKVPKGGISKQKNPDNDNEYDTTTAKDNILTTNYISSIDREAGNQKVTLGTKRLELVYQAKYYPFHFMMVS